MKNILSDLPCLVLFIFIINYSYSFGSIPDKIKIADNSYLIIKKKPRVFTDSAIIYVQELLLINASDTVVLAIFNGYTCNSNSLHIPVISLRHFISLKKRDSFIEIRDKIVRIKPGETKCSCNNGKRVSRQIESYFFQNNILQKNDTGF